MKNLDSAQTTMQSAAMLLSLQQRKTANAKLSKR